MVRFAEEPVTLPGDEGRDAEKPGMEAVERSQFLRLRNVWVAGRRTSLRLEVLMWDALEEVLVREDLTLDDLVTRLHSRRSGNLSSAVRTFLLGYFRSAATEQGHANAGHGLFCRR